MALNETHNIQSPLGFRLAGALSAGWARVAPALVDALHRAQVARMQSVLGGMSDMQLDEIGLKRRDIPARARELVLGEGTVARKG